MALPYKSHPLYNFRMAIIFIALIGVVLCILNIGPYAETLAGSAVLLSITVLFSAADLLCYAIKKVENPDADPDWPTRRWMVGDAILAVLQQFMFWTALLSMSYVYYFGVGGAYGILANLLCSILHAYCLWKQLMARYKKRWLADRASAPCPSCGYEESHQHSTADAQNPSTRAGPSFVFNREAMHTPESTESTMEEGLLIGSEYNGYGSIDDPEPTIQQPEEVVVGRVKKNKKAAEVSLSRSGGKKPQANTT